MRAFPLVLVLIVPNVANATDKPVLPAEWHGVWTGEMVLFSADGKTTRVPLTLTIAPREGSDGWVWKTVYGGTTPVVKDYILRPGDKAGRFVIDEGGGLELGARLDDRVMVSTFAVGETVLTARYEVNGPTLRFEVTSARKVGNALPAGVQGYEVIAVQRAELAQSK